MAVMEITKYVASDGTEFTDKKKAETHEATYAVVKYVADFLYNNTRLDHEDSVDAATTLVTHFNISKK